MPNKVHFKHPNSAALRSARAILSQILHGGLREGINYVVRNPHRNDLGGRPA